MCALYHFPSLLLPADELTPVTYNYRVSGPGKERQNIASDMLSGIYSSSTCFLNNYTAVYKFEGKNDFGEKFSFEVQADFQIGNFNNCD